MPAATGAFSNLIAPGLREVFTTDLSQAPLQAETVFRVETSDKHSEIELGRSTLGVMPQLTEGAGVTYDSVSEGYKKTYTHVQYGLGFSVTRVMWEDDLYRQMSQVPRELAQSARLAVETAASNVFNNGFSSSYLGADGKALFATDHPLIEGGTSTNTPSTNVDLSLTTLEAAITAFRGMKDDRGNKLVIPPKYLIVPAELEFTAKKLVGSQKDPESAYNTINPLNNALQVIVWDYLSDTDAWFVSAGPANPNYRLMLFWRKRPSLENDDDFATGNALFKSVMRFSVGWSDWRGVYGTSGG